MEKILNVIERYGGKLDDYARKKTLSAVKTQKEILKKNLSTHIDAKVEAEVVGMMISLFFVDGGYAFALSDLELFAREEMEKKEFKKLPFDLWKDLRVSFKMGSEGIKPLIKVRGSNDVLWRLDYKEGRYNQLKQEAERYMEEEERLKRAFNLEVEEKLLRQIRDRLLKEFIDNYPRNLTLKRMKQEIEKEATDWVREVLKKETKRQ